MNRNWVWAALSLIVGSFVAIQSMRSHSHKEASDQTALTSSAAAPLAATSVSAAALPKPKRILVNRDELWKSFDAKFGPDLTPQYSPDGLLITVRGIANRGGRASPEFSSSDAQKAIARAKEILEAARELMGIQENWGLENPISQGNDVSAQVFFRESHEGTPLAPQGSVKVDLGPEGELLALHSDYLPDVQVDNPRALDAEAARTRAVASTWGDSNGGITGPGKAEGGNPIIWVNPPNAGARPQGRQAYDYHVNGYQVVIDATTGQTLFRRDRKTN